MAGEEADLDPAEDVIHDRLGVADLLVAGPAGGLEAGVSELLAEHAQRHAVLEGERHGGREGVHQSGDGGAFLRHADKNFTRLPVGIEPDGDVAFMTCQTEFVRHAGSLCRQTVTDGARRGLGVGGVRVLERGFGDVAELSFERGDLLLSFELDLRGGSFGGDDGFLDLDGACGPHGAAELWRWCCEFPSCRHPSAQ